MHHDRSARRAVRLGHGDQGGALERTDAPVVGAALEQTCAHGSAIGRGSEGHLGRLEDLPVVGGHPARDVGDEEGRQTLGGPHLHRMIRAVVRLAVSAGRRDDVQSGRRTDPGQGCGVAGKAERCGIHHRLEPARLQQGCFFARGLLVVELVARKQRRHLEQVLVIVHPLEQRRVDIAEHRAHEGGHQRTDSAASASRSTISGVRSRSNTSATTCDQPWMK